MLTCALIVWLFQPLDWNQNDMRKTYLTETECRKNEKIDSLQCIKIDKRLDLRKKEWQKDNCSLSEHKWNGKK